MSNKTMKNKDIIVNQAEQIVKLNNEIDRLKNRTYELKKCFSEDVQFIDTAMQEMDEAFQKGELNSERHAKIQSKIFLRIASYLSPYTISKAKHESID